MKKLITFYVLFCFLTIGTIIAQNRSVSGVIVSSEDNEPVIGATVVVVGSQIGTVTDVDGKYTLGRVPAGAKTIKVSLIGFKTKEVSITGGIINVSLDSDATSLDEVLVVVPYGTSKKSSFTGSAATINTDQIAKSQSVSITKALEGVAPGVQVAGGDGQPGSNATIRIRGIGSINASNDPLYVIDGAPFNGDLSSINNEDIESLSVLKDAASAALYGARGANGVVMITTKKGAKGKATATAKARYGVVSRAIPQYSRVNSKEFYELSWEAIRNSLVNASKKTVNEANALASSTLVSQLGGYNSFNVANDQLVGTDGKFNSSAQEVYHDDWQDALFQNGTKQDYNIAINGGNDQGSYYGSVGYNKEQGLLRWTNFERFTGRLGMNTAINSWLKFDLGISGSTSAQRGTLAEGTYTSNPFYYNLLMPSIYPIYQYDALGNKITDSKGNIMYDMGGGTSEYAWAGHTRGFGPNSNLVLTTPLDARTNKRDLLSGHFKTEIKLPFDLKLSVMGSTDISARYRTVYQNNKYGDGAGVRGRSTKYSYRTKTYTFNQVLNWDKSFGQHTIGVLAGHENYLLNYTYLSATRTGYIVPTTELALGSTAEGSTSYTNEYAIESYFSQVNYNYADKYYLSASVRSDGSSRFYEDARWGTFWSLGGAWRLSQESFIQNIRAIDNLKLKASYGQQGNDALFGEDGETPLYYGWQSLYGFSNDNNDNLNNANANGAIHSQLLNTKLQWEKNANFNVGVEFGLLGKVTGEIEYFNRQSSNLLFQVPNALSNGIDYKWGNIGSLRNRGFEISLGFNVLKKADFNWNLGVNATHYSNKITKMPKNADGSAQEIINGTKKLSEGHSIYDFWLRDYAGVNPSNGDALYYMDTTDKDGNTVKTTTNDQNAATYYYVGNALSDVYGGITNTITYKGFTFSFLLSYQIGGKIYDAHYASLSHAGSLGTNWSTDMLKRWQKEGDVTDIPRLQTSYTAANIQSSRFLTNASFLSLKNVTLSYALPKDVLRKLEVKGADLYVSGDNLGLLTKRKGLNPQQSFNGTSDYTYSTNRVVSFGVNVTF